MEMHSNEPADRWVFSPLAVSTTKQQDASFTVGFIFKFYSSLIISQDAELIAAINIFFSFRLIPGGLLSNIVGSLPCDIEFKAPRGNSCCDLTLCK